MMLVFCVPASEPVCRHSFNSFVCQCLQKEAAWPSKELRENSWRNNNNNSLRRTRAAQDKLVLSESGVPSPETQNNVDTIAGAWVRGGHNSDTLSLCSLFTRTDTNSDGQQMKQSGTEGTDIMTLHVHTLCHSLTLRLTKPEVAPLHVVGQAHSLTDLLTGSLTHSLTDQLTD